MTDEPHKSQHNTATDFKDQSVRADGGSQLTNIRLVGFDKPLMTAIAIVMSVAAFIFGYEAWREAQADEYWLSRSEAFLEQLATQGVHVPDDLLKHKEK